MSLIALEFSLLIYSVNILESQAEPFLKVLAAFLPQGKVDDPTAPATWDYLLMGKSLLGWPCSP